MVADSETRKETSGNLFKVFLGKRFRPLVERMRAAGMQQMRTLARNMAFLMKSIAWGKRDLGLPEKEPFVRRSFIR